MANLRQSKTACLTCTPMRERNQAGREAVIAARRARSQESETGRICLTCNEWKPWKRFSNDPRKANGKASNCIDCGHWHTVKSLYGITRAEWEWLLVSQDGKCLLCGEGDTVRLNIDHDHACHPAGRACKKCIRGMLCRVCNRMLGHVEAKPALAARFADYLKRRPFLSVLVVVPVISAGAAEPVAEDVGALQRHDVA
jgi:Recombination endonuclease VII